MKRSWPSAELRPDWIHTSPKTSRKWSRYCQCVSCEKRTQNIIMVPIWSICQWRFIILIRRHFNLQLWRAAPCFTTRWQHFLWRLHCRIHLVKQHCSSLLALQVLIIQHYMKLKKLRWTKSQKTLFTVILLWFNKKKRSSVTPTEYLAEIIIHLFHSTHV